MLEDTVTHDVKAQEGIGDLLLLSAIQFEAHVCFLGEAPTAKSGEEVPGTLT